MANTTYFHSWSYSSFVAGIFGTWITGTPPGAYEETYDWYVADDAADSNWNNGSAGDGVEDPGEALQVNGVEMVFWSAVDYGDNTYMLVRLASGSDTFFLLGRDFDPAATRSTDEVLIDLGLSPDDFTINTVSYTYPVNFTGGSGNDYWAGNGFANSVIGAAGNDTFDGGDGNDTLIGDTGRDVLNGGAGDDSLLGGGSNDIITGGDGNDYLDGGNAGDKLYGNAGRDTLHGGASSDTLAGAGGRDVFLFDADLAANGIDTITDFLVGMDKVYVAVGVSGLGYTGELNAANFVSGAAATTSDQHFIYDSGNLYYDADGSGAGAQVQFATFSNAAVLSASDIVIV